MNYQNFRFVYSPQDEKQALNSLSIIKQHHVDLEKFYQRKLSGILVIYLPETKTEFNMITGGKLPLWSSAVFLPRQRMIVMKRSSWILGGVHPHEELLHELSHAYFYERFGGQPTPLWFNEGLAEFLSGNRLSISEGVKISNALFAKKIIPLSHIDSLLYFDRNRANLAYLQSYLAIEYLRNEYLRDQESWSDFLDRIERSGFEGALKRTTGKDLIDFEIGWYRWIEEKYRWLIILNIENLIWVALVIVLAGALYAIRYRNRKILERWELEDPGDEPLDIHWHEVENPNDK